MLEDAGGLTRRVHDIIYMNSLPITPRLELYRYFFPVTVLWLHNQFLYSLVFP